jgi:hypothetical protein
MVTVSVATSFLLAITARPRVSVGTALMVRSALDNVHIATAKALAVALLARLEARPPILLFIPSARWWWCTVSRRVLPVT